MSRLVIVLPLTPLRTGDSFAVHDWPLHVTVLPPFSTDATPDEIAKAIAPVTADQGAVTMVAGGMELFGRRANIPVSVLLPNASLTRLHGRLREAVLPFGAVPEEPAFTGSEYRPHVTIKRHARVHEGDELRLEQIAIVDMTPRSDPGGRSVLATLPLPNVPARCGAQS